MRPFISFESCPSPSTPQRQTRLHQLCRDAVADAGAVDARARVCGGRAHLCDQLARVAHLQQQRRRQVQRRVLASTPSAADGHTFHP